MSPAAATVQKKCTECGKSPVRAKGLCAAHYSQERRRLKHEAPVPTQSQLRVPEEGRREGTPKGKTARPKQRKVQNTLGGLLTLANEIAKGGLGSASPYPLAEAEVNLLAKTGAPVVLESETLTRWVEKLDGAGGPKVQFGAALLVVALPRAVEAKLIPAEQAQMVFGLALRIALADPDEFDEPTEPGPSTEGEPLRDAAEPDTREGLDGEDVRPA